MGDKTTAFAENPFGDREKKVSESFELLSRRRCGRTQRETNNNGVRENENLPTTRRQSGCVFSSTTVLSVVVGKVLCLGHFLRTKVKTQRNVLVRLEFYITLVAQTQNNRRRK